MTEAQTALSKRAVACKGWRWSPGMRTTRGERVVALVREAWEPYGTFVSTHRYDGGEWSIRTLPTPMFATEAEALVAALESAP